MQTKNVVEEDGELWYVHPGDGHRERVTARLNSRKQRMHKGGTHYEKEKEYNRTGLRGERHRIRCIHRKAYRLFKKFFGIDTNIHHEWIPGTAKYRSICVLEVEDHKDKMFENPVLFFTNNQLVLRTNISEMDGKYYEKTVLHHPDARNSPIAMCATVELSYKQHSWAHQHSIKELGEALLGE